MRAIESAFFKASALNNIWWSSKNASSIIVYKSGALTCKGICEYDKINKIF